MGNPDIPSSWIQIVIVAPTPAIRAGLRALLAASDQVQVVAEAAHLAHLTALPAGADLLLLASDGWDPDDLHRLLSPTPAALLLLLDGEPTAFHGLRELAGRAWGVLPLDCSAEELLAAVGALHEGLLVGNPALLLPLLDQAPTSGVQPVPDPLTERESQVLQLLAQGLANKQIAAALGISEHTVKFHVSAVYAKLGAASRTEAVRLGVRQGWIVL